MRLFVLHVGRLTFGATLLNLPSRRVLYIVAGRFEKCITVTRRAAPVARGC